METPSQIRWSKEMGKCMRAYGGARSGGKTLKWKRGQVPTWGARVNRWLAADDRHDFYVPSRDGGTTVYTLRNGSVVVARSHTLYNGENK